MGDQFVYYLFIIYLFIIHLLFIYLLFIYLFIYLRICTKQYQSKNNRT